MTKIGDIIQAVTKDGKVTRREWEQQLEPALDSLAKKATPEGDEAVELWGNRDVLWEGPDGFEKPEVFHRTGATFESFSDRLRNLGYETQGVPFGNPSLQGAYEARAANVTSKDDCFAWHSALVGRADREVNVAVLSHGFNLAHPGLEGKLVEIPNLPNDGINFAGASVDRPDFDQVGNHQVGLVTAGTEQVKALPLRVRPGLYQGKEWAAAIDAAVKAGATLVNVTEEGTGFSGDAATAVAAAIKRHPNTTFIVAGYRTMRGTDDNWLVEHKAPNMIVVDGVQGPNQTPIGDTFGPEFVHLAGPGEKLYSLGPGKMNRLHDVTSGMYMLRNGPAMSASVVSNIAAKCMALNGNLDAQKLKEILMVTSDPHPSCEGVVASGGIVNGPKAMACAAAMTLVEQGLSPRKALEKVLVRNPEMQEHCLPLFDN